MTKLKVSTAITLRQVGINQDIKQKSLILHNLL